MVLGKNLKISQRENPSRDAAINNNPQGYRARITPTKTKTRV